MLIINFALTFRCGFEPKSHEPSNLPSDYELSLNENKTNENPNITFRNADGKKLQQQQ